MNLKPAPVPLCSPLYASVFRRNIDLKRQFDADAAAAAAAAADAAAASSLEQA